MIISSVNVSIDYCYYLQSSTNGDIQIILRYDPSLSELSGLVVKASNLKKMDVTGLSG